MQTFEREMSGENLETPWTAFIKREVLKQFRRGEAVDRRLVRWARRRKRV